VDVLWITTTFYCKVKNSKRIDLTATRSNGTRDFFPKIHPTIHAPCEKALRQTLPGGLGIWMISVLVLLNGAAVLMKK